MKSLFLFLLITSPVYADHIIYCGNTITCNQKDNLSSCYMTGSDSAYFDALNGAWGGFPAATYTLIEARVYNLKKSITCKYQTAIDGRPYAVWFTPKGGYISTPNHDTGSKWTYSNFALCLPGTAYPNNCPINIKPSF